MWLLSAALCFLLGLSSIWGERRGNTKEQSLEYAEKLANIFRQCTQSHDIYLCETILLMPILRAFRSLHNRYPSLVGELLDSMPDIRWYCYWAGTRGDQQFASMVPQYTLPHIGILFDLDKDIDQIRLKVFLELSQGDSEYFQSMLPLVSNRIEDFIRASFISRPRYTQNGSISWHEKSLFTEAFLFFVQHFPNQLISCPSSDIWKTDLSQNFILGHFLLEYFLSGGNHIPIDTERLGSNKDLGILLPVELYLRAANHGMPRDVRPSESVIDFLRNLLHLTIPIKGYSHKKLIEILAEYVPVVASILSLDTASDSMDLDQVSWGQQDEMLKIFVKSKLASSDKFALNLARCPYADFSNEYVSSPLPDSTEESLDIVLHEHLSAYGRCIGLLPLETCQNMFDMLLFEAATVHYTQGDWDIGHVSEMLLAQPWVHWAIVNDSFLRGKGYFPPLTKRSIASALLHYRPDWDEFWVVDMIYHLKKAIRKTPELKMIFWSVADRLFPHAMATTYLRSRGPRNWKSCGVFCDLFRFYLEVSPESLLKPVSFLNGTPMVLARMYTTMPFFLNASPLGTLLEFFQIEGASESPSFWLVSLDFYLAASGWLQDQVCKMQHAAKLEETLQCVLNIAQRTANPTDGKTESHLLTLLLRLDLPYIAQLVTFFFSSGHPIAGNLHQSTFSEVLIEFFKSKKDRERMESLVTLGILQYGLGCVLPVPDAKSLLGLHISFINHLLHYGSRITSVDGSNCRPRSEPIGTYECILWYLPNMSPLNLLDSMSYKTYRDSVIDLFLHSVFDVPLCSTKFMPGVDEYLADREYGHYATFALNRYCASKGVSETIYQVDSHMKPSDGQHRKTPAVRSAHAESPTKRRRHPRSVY